ncbi:hypothetical protein F5Y16DRAFT_110043 [Xylariaceae sp. FL0255]|nr:hypothetical protein F5Y16DRAFT_110043 [Xylariaceae sp. FL0255]
MRFRRCLFVQGLLLPAATVLTNETGSTESVRKYQFPVDYLCFSSSLSVCPFGPIELVADRWSRKFLDPNRSAHGTVKRMVLKKGGGRICTEESNVCGIVPRRSMYEYVFGCVCTHVVCFSISRRGRDRYGVVVDR